MKHIVFVGNTHYDPVWLWRWDEALSSITATFKAALKRMEETPDFCYSFSAPAVMEQIEKTNPALFAQIQQRVKEGRWDLCEGWWLQADTNTGLGESYVRQGLYGQRYLQEKFGKISRGAFNIDSFGQSNQLPQILTGCGMDHYCFWRPDEAAYHLDSPLFRWEGGANSSVLTYRVGGNGGEIFTPDFEKETLLPITEDKNGEDLLVVFGVTDHGGAPTKEAIKQIEALREKNKGEIDISFGAVERYFDMQKGKEIKTVKGEIPVTFIGPSVNNTEVKRNNRLAEYSALNAEKVSVIAQKLMGTAYPKEEISRSWKDILFNQFHDIIGGCCIEDAYFDARNLHGKAIQTTNEIITYGLQSITNHIQMPGKNPDNEWNLVVWNLNCVAFSGEIEAEVQWAWEFPWYEGEMQLIDSEGVVYPCQMIREFSVVPGFRSRFVFKADIPALGYKTFIVKKTEVPYKHIVPTKVTEVAHGNYRLDFKDNTPKLYENGVLLTDKCLAPYAVGDICDTWGFNKTVYEDEKQYLTLESVEITETGAFLTKVKTIWRFRHSQVTVYYSLYENHIDVTYRALWQEEGFALKLELVNKGDNAKVVSATPYGKIERAPKEFECAMGEYVCFSSDNAVLSVVTDSLFAYNYDGKSVGFSVLRNCIYGDLRTRDLDVADYRYMGQGETKGKLRLFTHEQIHGLEAEAAHFNNPVRILLEANHEGDFPAQASFFQCDNDAFFVQTVKEKENGNGIVVRGVCTDSDKAQMATVTIFDKTFSTSILPEEIVTFTEFEGVFAKTNMLEE